eukprot:scaffold28112_cov112-Isochrysis_galbana.AAC.5
MARMGRHRGSASERRRPCTQAWGQYPESTKYEGGEEAAHQGSRRPVGIWDMRRRRLGVHAIRKRLQAAGRVMQSIAKPAAEGASSASLTVPGGSKQENSYSKNSCELRCGEPSASRPDVVRHFCGLRASLLRPGHPADVICLGADLVARTERHSPEPLSEAVEAALSAVHAPKGTRPMARPYLGAAAAGVAGCALQ